ncbi:hypothetical protein [Bremerella sp.]|uniref:hypothetical protein n=1 Tax=Bremerella sp. TaxID=2795602 RepID=UPI00391C57CC
MLKEIAFTPGVFDEEAQPDKSDWRDQLKELLSILAPKTGVCPIVISNLYDSGWYWEVERTLKSVEDPKLKPVCQGILTKMKDRLVKRPYRLNYPEDDAGWCREALASHAIDPIDRVVATSQTRATLADECPDVRGIDELEDAGFWHDINDRASPEAFFEDQIVLLRKLCLHSDWIAYCSPYANSSEMDFTIEFLKAATSRPHGFEPVEIEIHFDNWDRGRSMAGPQTERRTKQDRLAQFVKQSLDGILCTSNTVHFFCWEKLLERTLIAGDFRIDGDGKRRRRARWGLSMTHVARKRRPKGGAATDAEQETEPHRWSLMDKQELARPFASFIDEISSTRPTPSSLWSMVSKS